jgi:hypothetical protein
VALFWSSVWYIIVIGEAKRLCSQKALALIGQPRTDFDLARDGIYLTDLLVQEHCPLFPNAYYFCISHSFPSISAPPRMTIRFRDPRRIEIRERAKCRSFTSLNIWLLGPMVNVKAFLGTARKLDYIRSIWRRACSRRINL